MALPFLAGKVKRTQMVSVDLGSRITKAVLLEQRGGAWALTGYALLDAPLFEKKISPELLTEHLRAVVEALGTKIKLVTVALSLDDAVVRLVDLPQMPVDEMRLVLKKGTTVTDQLRAGYKLIAAAASAKVFANTPVHIHLCDEYFKTIEVVKS